MIVTYQQEKSLLKAMFTALGMDDADADILAEVPTHSDFTGVESHGMSRAVGYVNLLSKGIMNPKAELKTLMETESLMAFDCGDGSGVVSMVKAYEHLKRKAKANGIALAVCSHSSNIGCGNYYAWKAAEDDLMLIACANTYPLQAPFGGADPLLGSNPVIVSAPSGHPWPVALDMATTLSAMGKISAAARKGISIPDNWALDYDGRPTTDPNNYHTMLPLAGHKGYGLAAMVDVFAAVLSGAAYGTDIGSFRKGQPENSGWCMILIDPGKFMPVAQFKERMDEYITMLKSSRKAAGTEEIFLPGEIEYNTYLARCKSGFDIDPTLEAVIMERARQVGIANDGDTLAQLLEKIM